MFEVKISGYPRKTKTRKNIFTSTHWHRGLCEWTSYQKSLVWVSQTRSRSHNPLTVTLTWWRNPTPPAAWGETLHGYSTSVHMLLCYAIATTPLVLLWHSAHRAGLPVADNMRRYLMIKKIPFPWSRRDSTQNESSPLIPKVRGHLWTSALLCCQGASFDICYVSCY